MYFLLKLLLSLGCHVVTLFSTLFTLFVFLSKRPLSKRPSLAVFVADILLSFDTVFYCFCCSRAFLPSWHCSKAMVYVLLSFAAGFSLGCHAGDNAILTSI